jgi:hypothetical protein
MTLKEKFYPYSDNEYSEKWTSAENCEDVADEFAIEFAEWINCKGYKSYSNGWANFNTKAVSEKELLEIYKKEKGL